MLPNFQNLREKNGEEQVRQIQKQKCLNYWKSQDQNSENHIQQQLYDDVSQEREDIFMIEPPNFCFSDKKYSQSTQSGGDHSLMMSDQSSSSYSSEEADDYFRKQSQKLRSFVDFYYDDNYMIDQRSLEDEAIKQTQTILSYKQNNKRKKVLYQQLFKQQFLPERQIGGPRKFYLYCDLMIDFDYFDNIHQPDQYVNNNLSVQLTKGFKKTNSVIHRADSKFIEVDSEFLECLPQSIDHIIQMMKSIGNQDLIKYINSVLDFQKNIEICKLLIKSQSICYQFQEHRLERQAAGEKKYKQITSQLDPTKFIFYQRYSVDYERCLFQSTKAGYSPALYEVLDNGSYSFKDKLLKDGFYDPMSQGWRQGDCFFRVCYFMSELPSTFDQNLERQIDIEIITVDNFRFPVTLKLQHHYLEQEYDKQNGLNLKLCDLVAIYEYEFLDPNVLQNLQDIRRQAILYQSKLETIEGDDVDWNQFDYVQTEFFNKYYSEQIQNLVKKGNKWYKRCGFAEIPAKKVKK